MNATLPNIRSYGEYSSDNYGSHALAVDLGTIEVFYSYNTIIAYRDIEDGLTICENAWSTTTGKHLNWLDRDKSRRLNRSVFEDKLQAALKKHVS